MLRALSVAAFIALAAPAGAHDQWANGQPIPDWIKSSCCGPADAHQLRPDQVHDMGDYYLVDGYSRQIAKYVISGEKWEPASNIIPSQDGYYWIFYRVLSDGVTQSNVYCFFVPMDF